jgi:hypothetical protein
VLDTAHDTEAPAAKIYPLPVPSVVFVTPDPPTTIEAALVDLAVKITPFESVFDPSCTAVLVTAIFAWPLRGAAD